MDYISDTIAAISTPYGTGGLAVIRISGRGAVEVADKVFLASNKRPLCGVCSHTIHYGHVLSQTSGKILDEAMAAVMRTPRSFTGEDVVELSIHGSIIGARRVLESVLHAGARMADPGEFTKRAFLNGRLDLSQAEAVADIINSSSDAALTNAVGQLEGNLSSKIAEIREPLLYASAQFAAMVDYPDEDISKLTPQSLDLLLQTTLKQCDALLATADNGRMIKEGLLCVISGKPNVGKSSLLNALSHSQRAIVTEIEGTTRDVIEEAITLNGVPLRLVDTAGIRETDDAVEKIGVSRSRDYLAAAQLVMVLLDSSSPLTEEDMQVLSLSKGKRRFILLNKSDLPTKIDRALLREYVGEHTPLLSLSASTGDGLEQLGSEIRKMCLTEELTAQSTALSNLRHKEALLASRLALQTALESLRSGMPMDMCAIDIGEALSQLGLITGATVSADIVDKIFAEFCVGK